eukprot:TRINITY_DN33331_c0_g1_i1.p1 TRINITY_DN33331_c0_g1~~TRINITY_DN33331_c0_g1_i1.p1  ORF type:complete len:727 (-),score=178.01 TRINITY_DN33331_c0_g1_i1:76-2256(-)
MGYRIGGPFGTLGATRSVQAGRGDDERFATTYNRTFSCRTPAAKASLASSSALLGPAAGNFLAPSALLGNKKNFAAPRAKAWQIDKSASAGNLKVIDENVSFKDAAPPMLMSPSRMMLSPKTPKMLFLKTASNRELRRKCLETLANPQLEKISESVFKQYDKDGSGALDAEEIYDLLLSLHMEMALPSPDRTIVDNLIKKHHQSGAAKDVSKKEFFELFKAVLRRSAFDRGQVLGREFFVQKSGDKVWDVYDKCTQLGQGSYGQAFLAKQKANGEEVVVKAVKKSRTLLPLDEIEQEILIMRQIDHPHVVRLFEWYEDTNRIYLVLEVLRGGTLKDAILELQQKDQRGLKGDWIRQVIQQSAGAMAYCHNLRLIHKDIKDENIMLLKRDTKWDRPHAVIIDLGISEMFSVADPSGRMLGGSPTTMAPEVWAGTFGPKCDVWSLGCVLFQLCAGQYPFMSKHMVASAWTRLHRRGAKWDEMKTCGDSKALCKAMLSYNEEDRPTMKEVLDHPYFQKAVAELKAVPASKFKPLMDIVKMQRTRQSLLLEIASRLPISKSNDIIQIFSDIDTGHTGTIALPELVAYFAKIGIHDKDLVRKTFDCLDVDKDGSLSFSDFASGALLLFKDLLEDQLEAAFKRHDQDGDGILDRAQAEAFLDGVQAATDMNGKFTEEAQQFLKSGQIDFKQIRDYLVGPSVTSTPASSSRPSKVPPSMRSASRPLSQGSFVR